MVVVVVVLLLVRLLPLVVVLGSRSRVCTVVVLGCSRCLVASSRMAGPAGTQEVVAGGDGVLALGPAPE